MTSVEWKDARVDGVLVVVAVVLVLWLGGLWAAATRRHQRRRSGRDADWRGDGARPRLWTSQARCPHCSEVGGLLSEEGDQLWFACLACGRRHPRRSRG